MPGSEKGEAPKPSGFFGRFFNKGKSPIKAKLGDENKFVYNEKLKRWMMPGETVDESAAASAPPPMSRVPSSGSVGSDADKRSAAGRYAAVGFAAPRAGNPDSSSTSSAAFLPSPAKPPLGPPSKPAFFLPGAPSEGSTGAPPSANFFMPSTASTAKGAAPRFSGYKSPGSQAKRSPGSSQGVASEDEHASKRSKAITPREDPSSATVESSVTLAHGIPNATPSGSEVTLARGMGDGNGHTSSAPAAESYQGEESVGENTFGFTAASDAGEGVTSPGLKVDRLNGGNADADPEAASNAEASWGGAALGSGLENEPPLEAPDTSAQAAVPAEAVGPPPQRTDEDWYREMQFHYDASLQQGYSASETEDWLRQGYPALMEGFLPWYQANKEGPEQGHAMQASGGTTGMVQSEHPESAETSGAPILGGTALPLETKDAQENNQPVPADQHGVHSQPGPDGRAHGRMLSEIRSDVADHGSIISDRDEAQKTGSFGGRATESTASGKLTGPLPWDILDELSDDDDLSTTAGTPRYALTMTNGEPVLVDNRNPARPALAGAALVEAAEQASGRIAGWVTDLVKSGAIQHAVQHLPGSVATQSRFPRPRTDLKIALSHSPPSVHSTGTSMLANAGTPSSIKSVPAGSQHFEAQGMPHSAKAGQSSRSAMQTPKAALMEEQAMPEDPMEDAPAEDLIQAAPAALPEPQQRSDVTPYDGTALQDSRGDPPDQPQQDSVAEAAAEDGWDFEDSALEGLGGTQPLQAHEHVGHAPAAGSSSAIGIQTKAEDAYANGSVTGMSPPGGNWEGESELNFPLDDVPKEPKAALSSKGGELNLPEGGRLKKLVIPPTSPLKPLGSGAQPDSSAVLHEAMAHGDTNEKLAALQRRLEEVTTMHQQATDENESLRDQNGALEMELNDLKSQLDHDVLQTRQLEETIGDQRRMEEQLEEAVEELEDMRIKHDALKADNATLLAECKSRPAGSPGNKAAADANGDAGGHSVPGAAEAAAAQAAAAHPLVTVQLEAELAQARHDRAAAEERAAELEESVEQLMADLDISLQDVVSRDEEIDSLEARLAEYQNAAEKLQQLERDANAANQEVVQLADELEQRDERIEQLQEDLQGREQLLRQQEERLAARDAELVQLRAQLDNAGLDSGRVADLEAELTAAMSQVAAKALEAEALRKELEGAKAAAAQMEGDLKEQLRVQQRLTQDAQQQVQALRHELDTLQEEQTSGQQARRKVESELKALQESARLDFERIGALSEENTELKDQVEKLKTSREAAVSLELQELRSAQEAAQAKLAQAEATISALTSEKDTFAKRGSKLQARFTKSQGEAAKKQEQAVAQLAELQQKLDNALAASPTLDSAALQEALDKVSALEQQAAEAEAREAEANNRADEAQRQLAMVIARADKAEQAAAETSERAEAAERQRTQAVSLAEARQAEAVAEVQQRLKEAEVRATEASEQLPQESELRSTAEQRAADAQAARESREADSAAQCVKVSELEEEASSLLERLSGLEEELGAAQAQARLHAQALAATQAEIGELKAKLAANPAPAEAPEDDGDMENLMSALGQESEKVDRLVELLQERGFDPMEVLDEIEERYAMGWDAEDEEVLNLDAPEPAEGPGGPVSLHSNAAFDDSHDRGASDTDGNQEASAALTEHPEVAESQQGGFKGFEDELVHQVEGAGQPERGQQQAEKSVSGYDGWGDEVGNSVEKSIEDLPEGELLSPPQLPQGKPEKLAAQIDFGQAGTGDGWDNWDEDIGSSLG